MDPEISAAIDAKLDAYFGWAMKHPAIRPDPMPSRPEFNDRELFVVMGDRMAARMMGDNLASLALAGLRATWRQHPDKALGDVLKLYLADHAEFFDAELAADVTAAVEAFAAEFGEASNIIAFDEARRQRGMT